MLIDQARPKFLEQPNHTRGSRSAGHPQRQRVILWVVLALEVPEEQMLRPNIEPPSVLGRVRIADRVILPSDTDRMFGRVFACKHLEPVNRGLVAR